MKYQDHQLRITKSMHKVPREMTKTQNINTNHNDGTIGQLNSSHLTKAYILARSLSSFQSTSCWIQQPMQWESNDEKEDATTTVMDMGMMMWWTTINREVHTTTKWRKRTTNKGNRQTRWKCSTRDFDTQQDGRKEGEVETGNIMARKLTMHILATCCWGWMIMAPSIHTII